MLMHMLRSCGVQAMPAYPTDSHCEMVWGLTPPTAILQMSQPARPVQICASMAPKPGGSSALSTRQARAASIADTAGRALTTAVTRCRQLARRARAALQCSHGVFVSMKAKQHTTPIAMMLIRRQLPAGQQCIIALQPRTW